MICRSTNNSLEVFIKVGLYFALPDEEPKRYYQRSHLLSFVVDRDKCVLLNLIDYMCANCIWGLKQYRTLWLSLPDDVAIEIKSDEQLLEWFELNIESGIMCVDAEIKDFNELLQFSASKPRAWQVTGQPCNYALLVIAKLSREVHMEEFFP
jgi:hypothetical protein